MSRHPIVAIASLVVISLVTASSVIATSLSRSNALGEAIDERRARNVILLVGDGMGTSEVTSARNYRMGAAGKLTIDRFVLGGQVTTHSVLESDPAAPEYDTDSAAAATAWSTGHKTSNGRISTAPGTDADLEHLIDRAEEDGYRTGIVSTADVTDATPAAPMSHVRDRSCQGPADMAECPQDAKDRGGPGSIAEQSIDRGVDVILGGGRARYEQVITGGRFVGQTVVQQAVSEGYAFVADAAALTTVGTAERVLGLFQPGNLSTEWGGAPAAPGGTGDPQRCLEGQQPAGEPSLDTMTDLAIDILDRGTRGPGGAPGFFLQVEGGLIDKSAHHAEPCQQIGEMLAFDRAIGVAVDYARRRDDTLVIVTADHGQSSLIVESTFDGPGLYSSLMTDEGQPMVLHYGTAPGDGSQQHSGTTVPIYATGPRAAELTGLIDHTHIFHVIVTALEI